MLCYHNTTIISLHNRRRRNKVDMNCRLYVTIILGIVSRTFARVIFIVLSLFYIPEVTSLYYKEYPLVIAYPHDSQGGGSLFGNCVNLDT